MDINFFNRLSNLIEREKETSSILYSIKNFKEKTIVEALKHNQSIYKLLKLYSKSGFMLPIEEPKYIAVDFNETIETCLDDLEFYKIILSENTELAKIVPELIETKIFIIRTLTERNLTRARTFTLEELKSYNGRDGMPAYVAVNGVVYDVTNSPVWMEGTHFELMAGRDLSDEFKSCHSSNAVLSTLPAAGTLVGGA